MRMSNATIYVFVSITFLLYKYCYSILTRKEAKLQKAISNNRKESETFYIYQRSWTGNKIEAIVGFPGPALLERGHRFPSLIQLYFYIKFFLLHIVYITLRSALVSSNTSLSGICVGKYLVPRVGRDKECC